MSDDEFATFLNYCRSELAKKQAVFQDRIKGCTQWHCEMASNLLVIGDERFPVVAIGTHSNEYQTWLWAWANDSFPPACRAAAETLQVLHATTGFQVFLEPGIPASATDAEGLAAIAVHQLDAIGFFRDASSPRSLYLAVLPRAKEAV